jgi:hypothetical protein
MQAHTQEEVDSRTEPSPMAIIGAILAQGAIRWMDRQEREQIALEKKTSTSHRSLRHSSKNISHRGLKS